jgi:hypothetical protein
MTRKQKHAEAVKRLDAAAGILDQAHSLLKAARTAGAVETGNRGGRVTARSIVDTACQLVQSAREVTCEDCDLLIADCQCEWSNQEVK